MASVRVKVEKLIAAMEAERDRLKKDAAEAITELDKLKEDYEVRLKQYEQDMKQYPKRCVEHLRGVIKKIQAGEWDFKYRSACEVSLPQKPFPPQAPGAHSIRSRQGYALQALERLEEELAIMRAADEGSSVSVRVEDMRKYFGKRGDA